MINLIKNEFIKLGFKKQFISFIVLTIIIIINYFINNEKVRLKDITELLIDSGSAKESFSIISQGDISNVLSTKPEDRRIIFESAAGVLKYKKRKEEATKKLDKTHDNIDRINDIINELEIQVLPLKEQSEKAEKYLSYKKELEDIEISLIASDLDNINTEYTNSKSKIDILNKELVELSTSSSSFDADLSMKKLKLSKLNEKIYDKQSELINITTKVEQLNGKKNIISERKKYEVDNLEETIKRVQKYNIKIKACIMLGIPGQSRESIIKTFSFLNRLQVEVRPTIYTPYQQMNKNMTIDEIESYNRKLFHTEVEGVTHLELLKLVYEPRKFKEILDVKE